MCIIELFVYDQVVCVLMFPATADVISGDLIYLEVQFDDNETFFVTGHRNGFYVNKLGL